MIIPAIPHGSSPSVQHKSRQEDGVDTRFCAQEHAQHIRQRRRSCWNDLQRTCEAKCGSIFPHEGGVPDQPRPGSDQSQDGLSGQN